MCIPATSIILTQPIKGMLYSKVCGVSSRMETHSKLYLWDYYGRDSGSSQNPPTHLGDFHSHQN